LRLNGKPALVTGIANAEFTGLSLEQPDAWAPVIQQPYFVTGSKLLTDLSEGSSGVEVWGRLQPGLSPRAAEQELQSLTAELRRQYPKDIWEDERPAGEQGGYAQSLLAGGKRGTGREDSPPIYPAAAIVGTLTLLILAVACFNLGSL